MSKIMPRSEVPLAQGPLRGLTCGFCTESALLVVLRGLIQQPLPGPACSLRAKCSIEGGSPRNAPDPQGGLVCVLVTEKNKFEQIKTTPKKPAPKTLRSTSAYTGSTGKMGEQPVSGARPSTPCTGGCFSFCCQYV